MNEVFVDVIKKYMGEASLEVTDAECEIVFEEMSKHASSFEDLHKQINIEFGRLVSVNMQFNRWTEKLALDRNKLLEVSKNFGK